MVRPVALLLTLLTGFSGLVYEVTWEKYLAALLGSHAEATAAVLGIFLGGLAVGYALFGRVTVRLIARTPPERQVRALLVVYGCLEGGIGVFALAFPFLFQAIQALSIAAPFGVGGAAFAFDVVLATLLIGPGSILMGGTIPMLTQALARNLDDSTHVHAQIYAFNTVGAFAGALAAGFWLIPSLGLIGVLTIVGLVNLTAGAVFIALGVRGHRAESDLGPEGGASAKRIPGFANYAAIAVLGGFAMMTIQTVLIRVAGLSLGASQFTFSMVVAVFVLCIAIGSFVVSFLPRIPRWLLAADLWALLIVFYGLYGNLDDSPYWAHTLRSMFRDVAAAFYPYYGATFVALLVVVGPGVILSGATLPLLFHTLRREVGEVGNVAGGLYSWNTAGSFIGALLGGYVLLQWVDLDDIFRLALLSLAVAAALANARLFDRGRAVGFVLLLAATSGAVALLPDWSADRLSSGLFRMRQPLAHSYGGPDAFFASNRTGTLLFHDDDPTATVAVRESKTPDAKGRLDRSIINNGKSDGAVISEYVTMGMASLLPALLADRAERAFVIGFGTGVTVGEFAALDTAKEVVVAEISPGVIEAAPYFDYANQNVTGSPIVRMLRSDAYRALLRSEGTFDVIASEPSNPWITGVEMLFSREFLAAARDRLNPGGVYAQWFHIYETNAETISMVFRTYASVFDHIVVWYAHGYDLLLLGIKDPEASLDLGRIAKRFNRPDFRAGFSRCGINGLPALLAHELLPLGVVHASPLIGQLHTLLHPRLSYTAARAFFAGRSGGMPATISPEAARVGATNSLVRQLAVRAGGQLPERARAGIASELCSHRPHECVAFLAEWVHDKPQSALRRELVAKIKKRRDLAAATPLQLVAPLSALYGPPISHGTGPRAAFEQARTATDQFRKHYHHAAPFDRRHIAALWNRCGDEARCTDGRRRAEQNIGGLGSPPAPRDPVRAAPSREAD